jgi:hypothetical protein
MTMSGAYTLVVAAALACGAVTVANAAALAQARKDAQADDDQTKLNKALNLAAASGRLDQVKDQGQHSLWRCPSKYWHQEVIAPAATTSLHGDAVLAREEPR